MALLAQRLIQNPAIRELGRLATRAGPLCAANGQLAAWATLARSASAQRKLDKQFAQNTFEFAAIERIERQKTKWSPSYAETTYRRLKRNLFPFIGSRPVNGITAPELLALLLKVEARGIIGTAHTLKNHCSCSCAMPLPPAARKVTRRRTCAALSCPCKKHRPALTTPEKLGRLVHAIYNYQGALVVRSALQIMALTFCRTTEIRCAEWREFDFEDNIWRIPAERMKMRRDQGMNLGRAVFVAAPKRLKAVIRTLLGYMPR